MNMVSYRVPPSHVLQTKTKWSGTKWLIELFSLEKANLFGYNDKNCTLLGFWIHVVLTQAKHGKHPRNAKY